MFVTLFGAPTQTFKFVSRIAIALLRSKYPDLTLVNASDIEQFKTQIVARGSNNLFYCSERIDADIIRALASSRAPCIIFDEDALSLLPSAQWTFGTNFRDTLNACSYFYSSAEMLSTATNVAYLDPKIAENDLGCLIARLAELLACDLDETALDQVWSAAGDPTRRLSLTQAIWGEAGPIAFGPDVASTDIDMLRKCFPPLTTLSHLGFRWPGRLFFAEEYGTPGDRVVNLTGKARTIFFGPYLYLPMGAWRAAFHINVARNQSGNILLADLQCNLKVLAVGRMPLPREGSFQFSLDFEMTTMDQTMEARIGTLEGAIDGVIELVDVSLVRR